jgi:hypothetical protein
MISSLTLLYDKIERVIAYEASIEDKILNKISIIDFKDVLSVEGVVSEEAIANNKRLAEIIEEVIKYEETELLIRSPRCEDLFHFKEMLEANLEMCDVMTTDTRKITVDRVREIKKIYNWAEEEYIDFRTANKKLHIKQLMAQADDFMKRVREANFVQRVSVDKNLSLKEIIERLKIKKTV